MRATRRVAVLARSGSEDRHNSAIAGLLRISDWNIAGRWRPLWTDAVAGFSVSFAILPSAIASGILAYSFLGPDQTQIGSIAGFYGLILGAACVALLATSSPILPVPRSGSALIILSAGTYLVGTGLFPEPVQVLALVALCIAIANVLLVLFGLCGIARVIAFVPYPALAGFMNGIGLSIIWAQLRPLTSSASGWPPIGNLPALAFMVSLAAFVFFYPRLLRLLPARLRGISVVPGAVTTIALGSAVYYLTAALAPGADLGRLMGPVSLAVSADSFALSSLVGISWPSIWAVLPTLLLLALSLAALISIETLTALRMAQTTLRLPVSGCRDLTAYGMGNLIVGAIGGMPTSAAPAPTAAAFRQGGRSRIVSLAASLTIALLATVLGDVLAAIPVAVFNALLIFVGLTLLDGRSFRAIWSVLRGKASRRDPICYDVATIVAVAAATAGVSILAGIVTAIVASCLSVVLTIAGSPIDRYFTVERPGAGGDPAARANQAILQLRGALFFANSERLLEKASSLLTISGSLTIDFKQVWYVDWTAAKVIAELIEVSRRERSPLLLCAPPTGLFDLLRREQAPLLPIFESVEAAQNWLKSSEAK